MKKLRIHAPRTAGMATRKPIGCGGGPTSRPDHHAAKEGVHHCPKNGFAHGRAELVEQEVIGFVEHIGDRAVFDRVGDGVAQARAAELDGLGHHQVPERVLQGQPVDHRCCPTAAKVTRHSWAKIHMKGMIIRLRPTSSPG